MTNRKTGLLFLLAVLLGIGMRFYGLKWGLPYHFHSDERIMSFFTEKLRTAESIAQLTAEERRFFLYPPFLMYLQIALVTLASVFHRFSHTDPGSLTLFYLLGRGLVAGFGSATLILVYRLGRRLYSGSVGMLAAAFLAFTVLHVRDSHFYFPDVPMTFFVVLTVLCAVGIIEGKGVKAYLLAGLFAGMGMATKQTALMVLPAILVAHVLGTFRDRPLSWNTLGKGLLSFRFWGLLALPLLVAGVTFLLLNPFVLINPRQFLEMSHQTAAFVKGIRQNNWTFQFTGLTIGYWFSNLLYFGMGPLLECVSLAGVLWAGAIGVLRAAGRRITNTYSADALLLAFILPYFGLIGGGYLKFIRYALPLLPFLCLLGARCLIDLGERAGRGRARAAVTALTATVILGSFFYALAYLNVYRQEDARLQASRWIHQNIPRDSTVLIDSSSATPLLGSMFFQPEFYVSYMHGLGPGRENRQDYYRIKVLKLITEVEPRPRSSPWWEAYLEERLKNVEYIIMSDERPEQYSHRPDDYPILNRFYRALFAGRTDFREIKTFKTRPSLFGLTLNDDRAELTFRLFDHPKIMIFRRDIP